MIHIANNIKSTRSVSLAIRALSSLEAAFNHLHHYPLVIFHEEDEDEMEKYHARILKESSFSGIQSK